MSLLLLLMACTQADGDRDAYLAALHATSPAAAVAACGRIDDPVLHGECSLFAAAALARSGADGRAACGGIGHEAWRGACYFEIAEAMALRGSDAREACGQAGGFRSRCLAHALNRDGPEVANSTTDEAAMLRALIGQARALGLAGREAAEGATDVVAQHVAGRWRQRDDAVRTFRRIDCGTAGDSACAKAYRLVVKDVAGSPRPTSPCVDGATREAVAAAGLPVWDDKLAPLAVQVWAGICR
ncbi:MAG: hypothetical protein VX265_04005 [Myxococcota bacterium]|nr:hypothetical protein [Myxococcota bacterium]MEC8424605.1 hypothetical protein [Myxococcota bacterium]